MPRIPLLLTALLAAAPALAGELTVASIMARDRAGTSPENPAWSDDGRSVVFELRRPGTRIVDLWRIDLPGGRPERVDAAGRAKLDAAAGAVESRDRRLKAFVRDGDLFVADRRSRRLHQVTRTSETESQPLPLEGGRRVAFRRGDAFFEFDLESGRTSTLADLRLADEPDSKLPEGYLAEAERRLLRVPGERREREEAVRAARRERCASDPTCPPEPWWLGEGQAILAAALAPDASRLALVVGPARDLSEELEQGADGGKADTMPLFVTDSGYVETKPVRPKVGTGTPASPRLLLLDLARHESTTIDHSALPGLREDPRAELRRQAAAPSAGDAPEDAAAPAERVVSIETLLWSDDSRQLAVQLFSYDNKDRWIAVVDAAAGRLTPLERIHDPAWIGWRFNDLGWMPDGRTLWYLSEETGFSQLWLRPLAGDRRQLTAGEFEIDAPRLSRDGRAFFVEANRDHPGIVEILRVDATSGEMTQLTTLGGLAAARLSPDEKRLLLTVSKIAAPPELYLQEARPGAPARRLTETVAADFAAEAWTIPEVVAVPSRHGAGKIHGRLYKPADWTPERRWPAVLFVHGAGYLQNAHYGWSPYPREFMFHTLLTRRGYVVLDLDYRASAGYGRAWRTAIYRQMGTPEVEDLADGVAWLVDTQAVEARRVGVYGGSYGGFLTFMSMFRRPELFAAGAALRPVADWAHYNHGYTSNILNTPDVDPQAYRSSSPIEYAEGLARPLLICHGMVDDNVVFQDSVRLVQRLIELGKTEWFETAIYPVEPHAFRDPSSWTDEYTRILRLFEANLGPGAEPAVSAPASGDRR
jgi:dipeptidyl aminopeptidase/acylaminoacyl peptidase